MHVRNNITHETYLTFDSKSLNTNKNDYRLNIKTTPRNITSFEIIAAQLPRIPDARYIIMKIHNLDNTVSLSDSQNCLDNAFAVFYYEDDSKQFVRFNKSNIHPNTLNFHNPLSSLHNLHVQWYDENNNKLSFLIPRFKIKDHVIYIHENSIHNGTIYLINITNTTITYNIESKTSINHFEVPEKDIIYFLNGDKVFIYYKQQQSYARAVCVDEKSGSYFLYDYNVYIHAPPIIIPKNML